MKIGAVSDIHIDINKNRGYPFFEEKLIEYLESLDLDILIIPGDISDTVKSIENFFRKAMRIRVKKKIFVPGNHDIWVNSKTTNGSMIKYTRILPELCCKYDWHFLPGNPFSMGDAAFAGTMGWYDYSTKNPAWSSIFSDDDYRRKKSPGGSVWMDVEYARFGMDDKDLARLMADNLLDDLKMLGVDLGKSGCKQEINFKKIIFVSHFVPYIDFITFYNNPEYDFFGAFIGNTRLGEIMDAVPREIKKLAFFGHTHHPLIKEAGERTESYCVPFGYPSEHMGLPLHELMKKRVALVMI